MDNIMRRLSTSLQTSYTVNIVGGAVQRIPNNRDKDAQSAASSNSLLRKKNKRSAAGGTFRRISCKDLGHGDCQGWLHKRKESSGLRSAKWVKRWFVLKEQKLYYYKSQEDMRAEGLISLPGFKISPDTKVKSKKYVFKVELEPKLFTFASESEVDRTKWMNKMSMAALRIDMDNVETTAGFSRPRVAPINKVDDPYISETDSEHDESATSTPNISRRGSEESILDTVDSSSISTAGGDSLGVGSTDDLRGLIRLQSDTDAALKRNNRVSTMAPTHVLNVRNSRELEGCRKLSSLERSLRDKEHQLQVLEDLLSVDHITSETLRAARDEHPAAFTFTEQHTESSTPAEHDSSSDSFSEL